MTQSKERVMGEEGLYRSSFEHDNCGIGAVVNIKGEKSHATVENALKIVENLEHRAGKDAEGKTGDGVGILLQISHKFFSFKKLQRFSYCSKAPTDQSIEFRRRIPKSPFTRL